MVEVWLVYDARAWDGDTDSATVLVACDSKIEAEGYRKDMWPDSVIYGYDDKDGVLVNQQGPY